MEWRPVLRYLQPAVNGSAWTSNWQENTSVKDQFDDDHLYFILIDLQTVIYRHIRVYGDFNILLVHI